MSSAFRYLLAITHFRSPLLRTLVPTVALAYTLQAAAAVPSIAVRTERFYDLSGSLTYLSCTALSLYLPVLRARAAASGSSVHWPNLLKSALSKGEGGWDWRQVILSAAVGLWATRLGSHLFSRITADDGRDSRFDDIRGSPPKFLTAFFAQATWVSLCLLPVTALNSLPSASFSAVPAPATALSALGIGIYVFGFLFEVIADRQKSAWVKAKKEKKHSEEFLTTGLWGKSRHPNYFGEITLWTGLAASAASVLVTKAGLTGLGLTTGLGGKLTILGMCAASPAFVATLLLKVSGIPLSENKYDKRYGDRKDYKEWKENTPMLIPKLG